MARDPDTRIPFALINRRSSERHYAIAAVSEIEGSPRTEYVYWCRIPAGFHMCMWKLQPGSQPLCGVCVARAQAIGKPADQPEDLAQ